MTPGPGIAELVEAFAELRVANTRLLELLSARLGIVPTDIRALVALGRGELTPKRVAEQLELSTGAMTSLLDRLEAAGFAQRIPNPTDRRSLLVALTDSGRAALGEGAVLYYAAFEAAVPVAERASLAAAFRAIAAQLHEQGDGMPR